MKTEKLLIGMLVAMLLSMSACGGDPGAEETVVVDDPVDVEDPPSVGDLIDEYFDEMKEQVAILCDCWEEFSFASRNDCVSNRSLLPSQLRCIKEALSRDPEAAEQYLDCRLQLEHEYTQCIYARLDCDDYYSADACIDDFELGYSNCIELPPAIVRAMDEC